MRYFRFPLVCIIALTTVEACASNFKLYLTGDDQMTTYVSRAAGTSTQLGGNPTDFSWGFVDSHPDFNSVSLSAGDVLSFYYYNQGGASGMLARFVETSSSSPAEFVTGPTPEWVCAGIASGTRAHTPTRLGGNLDWTHQGYNAAANGFTQAVQYATNVAGLSTPWGVVGTSSEIGPNARWIGPTSTTKGSNVLHGFCRFTVPEWTCSGGTGDPVFAGFQGQEFQFHGLADEHFNLVSSPLVQLNAHFVYLSAGNCVYNHTACFSHPGTYMDVLGFSIGGEHDIKLQAGSHATGLRLWIGDREIEQSLSHTKPLVLTIANTSHVATVQYKEKPHPHVRITTPLMDFEITNSDYFFNFKLALHDSHALRIGSTRKHLNTKELCTSGEQHHVPASIESAVSALYPIQLPLHGLVGQTWRNVRVCSRDWMGSVEDYLVSNLFETDYQYNYYLTSTQAATSEEA